jgi:RNA polymerase sigma-70 factor, ECF subfamily
MNVKRLKSRGRPLTQDELETIYRRVGAAFERVAIAIVGDEQRGCDAVHDAFVLALRSRDQFRGEAPAEAWLWRIVVNEARKARAQDRRVDVTDPSQLDLGEDATSSGDQDYARVRRVIATLPEQQRAALFLRYYADLDYATIAQALDVKPGTVAATLSAARERLRAQLEEVLEWEA